MACGRVGAPGLPLAARAPSLRGSRPAAAGLTAEQAAAVAAIEDSASGRDARPILLDGVTGGGKTAIYSEALAAALERGRPGLVLVPEVSLALPLIDRLRPDLGARVPVLPTGLGEGERADEWRRIRDGAFDVVIGSRSAVFAPQPDLGLIVIDEEHEWTYKQHDAQPRYHARDAAIELARLNGAALVLGSATPAGASTAYTLQSFGPDSTPGGGDDLYITVTVSDLRKDLTRVLP